MSDGAMLTIFYIQILYILSLVDNSGKEALSPLHSYDLYVEGEYQRR